MIRVSLSGMSNYSGNLTTNKAKIDSASKALDDLMKSLPNGAWQDPEEKAFLGNFTKFLASAQIIQDQMENHIRFISECESEYFNAKKTALDKMVKF